MKNICETCRLERRCNGSKYCLIEKAQKELFEMAVELAVLQAREAARQKAEKVFCDEKVMRCEHCRWYAARDARHGECWQSPPQVLELRIDDEFKEQVISRRPVTHHLARCSHWEASDVQQCESNK